MRTAKHLLAAFFVVILSQAHAQPGPTQAVVDIPTRPGVTQRIIIIAAPAPKATVILLAGGHGGLQIMPSGLINWGQGNFLVRTRQLFADQGLTVAVVDAPSDRQSPPYLQGYRQTPEHVADLKAVIKSLRDNTKVPVWLIGASRGTQSVAYAATELSGLDGPDGIVLSSSILTDNKGRAVSAMPLGKIRVPVLVVHHQQDGCSHCSFSEVPTLMAKLANSSKTQLLPFNGGENKGDPCEAFSHHGFNGIEAEVVRQIAAWIVAK